MWVCDIPKRTRNQGKIHIYQVYIGNRYRDWICWPFKGTVELMIGRYLIVLLCLLALPAVAQDELVYGFSDLPLAPGLHNVDSASSQFDTASGSIVEAVTTTEGKTAEVVLFYAETLPQLGWRTVSPNTYEREGEQLKITVDESMVRFSSQPISE